MREYVRFSRNAAAHRIIGEMLDAVSTAILPVLVMILLFTYVFRIATVQGDSMLPTLQENDRLLVLELNKRPANHDVVIVHAETASLIAKDGSLYTADGLHKSIVKRVIAVGGQTLDIDAETGVVSLNGVPQEEVYTNTITQLPDIDNAFLYPITIPEGFVFVMGDNRDISMDSRYTEVGLVAESDIEGVVLLRVYPLESAGFLESYESQEKQ